MTVYASRVMKGREVKKACREFRKQEAIYSKYKKKGGKRIG